MFCALLPQVNFPANNFNFHWRWWDRIQAIFLNLFYFMFLLSKCITSSFRIRKYCFFLKHDDFLLPNSYRLNLEISTIKLYRFSASFLEFFLSFGENDCEKMRLHWLWPHFAFLLPQAQNFHSQSVQLFYTFPEVFGPKK